uniref:Myb-like DNA-binding domain-containing protein n=1 Tax=Trepomonas sp. PC1 TaxID=1076344 RepID=A0A146KIQ4_9EUKA|eukprot:JAP96542.1 Myb-like DNA-binding domain-containing protein [Trepomonas sp. PC1]
MKNIPPKSKWSDEDVNLLKKLSKEHVNNGKQILWDRVMPAFPDRTKNQIKTFFFNYIKPQLDPTDFKQNTKWDPNDDEKLLKLVENYGKKWNTIVKFISSYSAQQLKLRYFYIIKHCGAASTPKQPGSSKEKRNVQLVSAFGQTNSASTLTHTPHEQLNCIERNQLLQDTDAAFQHKVQLLLQLMQ